jgi:hypothetical protein
MRARTGWAIAVFIVAVLTKEIYYLVPFATAFWIWQRQGWRKALVMAVLPLLPLVAWDVWVSVSFPAPTASVKIFGLPFAGIIAVIPVWLKYEREFSELVLASFALLMITMAASMLVAGGSSMLRLIIAPWLAVACCSAFRMWGKPNNAARAFAILWPLSVLLFSQWLSSRDSRKIRIGP